jgi:4'-phosphopantetheinyl transferase
MHDPYLQRVTHGLPGDVQVWWVDLDAYAAAVSLDGLRPDEYARADRLTLGRDGPRFLASRHALRQVVAHMQGRPPEELILGADEFGKPHLERNTGLLFNLSRSAHQGLIGLSVNRPIGVDIELVRGVADAEALAEAHFTDAEREQWSGAAGPRRDRTFLTCWTRKEACVKALGVGLSAQPGSFDVGCTGDRCTVAIPIGQEGCEIAVCSLDLPGESVAAVALATPEAVGIARQHFRKPAPPASLGWL